MREHVFTPDQIVAGIGRAVEGREFYIIPGLVRLLAAQDPQRAQAVLDALRGRVTVVIDLKEAVRG